MKKGSLTEFAILDDIGYIGIPGYRPSPEDRAFMAQKAEESRQRYRATQSQNKKTPVLA